MAVPCLRGHSRCPSVPPCHSGLSSPPHFGATLSWGCHPLLGDTALPCAIEVHTRQSRPPLLAAANTRRVLSSGPAQALALSLSTTPKGYITHYILLRFPLRFLLQHMGGAGSKEPFQSAVSPKRAEQPRAPPQSPAARAPMPGGWLRSRRRPCWFCRGHRAGQREAPAQT